MQGLSSTMTLISRQLSFAAWFQMRDHHRISMFAPPVAISVTSVDSITLSLYSAPFRPVPTLPVKASISGLPSTPATFSDPNNANNGHSVEDRTQRGLTDSKTPYGSWHASQPQAISIHAQAYLNGRQYTVRGGFTLRFGPCVQNVHVRIAQGIPSNPAHSLTSPSLDCPTLRTPCWRINTFASSRTGRSVSDLWFEGNKHVDVLRGEATPQAPDTRWGRFITLGVRHRDGGVVRSSRKKQR